MRIITGKAKGHHLKFPKGTKTRPVTDLMRGAIFTVLEHTADDWSRVLDIFAGSGALGIEALSRGADWADFVESEPKCCDIIKENLEITKLADQSHVYCCQASKALGFLDKEYNIILMDPPYASTATGDFMQQLAASRLVGPKTVVVMTHASRVPIQKAYGALHLIKEQRHGDSCAAFFQKEAES